MTTWTLAEDGTVEPTLWHGRMAILRRRDISAGGRTMAEATAYGDLLWDVLRRVLAPDEATVERLADAIVGCCFGQELPEAPADLARAVLAALTDTRDTGTEAVSGHG